MRLPVYLQKIKKGAFPRKKKEEPFAECKWTRSFFVFSSPQRRVALVHVDSLLANSIGVWPKVARRRRMLVHILWSLPPPLPSQTTHPPPRFGGAGDHRPFTSPGRFPADPSGRPRRRPSPSRARLVCSFGGKSRPVQSQRQRVTHKRRRRRRRRRRHPGLLTSAHHSIGRSAPEFHLFDLLEQPGEWRSAILTPGVLQTSSREDCSSPTSPGEPVVLWRLAALASQSGRVCTGAWLPATSQRRSLARTERGWRCPPSSGNPLHTGSGKWRRLRSIRWSAAAG